MPRRDGTPTLEEIVAAQRAGQGPPPQQTGGPPSPLATAIALQATTAAAGTAASAPPIIAPALTVAAVNAAAASIIGAFDVFLAGRRRDQEGYVAGLLEAEIPELPADARLAVLGQEMDAEQAFSAKARDRLSRDLPKALAITDPHVREAEVQKVLDRERRYAEMREMAMAARTLGTAEQRHVEQVSPEGGFWHLSEGVKQHTLDCLAMGNKAWPHSVLRTYHPPLHGGCGCEIWPIQQAARAGLLRHPGQVATPDESVQAMQVAEAPIDREEFEEEMAVLEATFERWWRGTAGPGQFRSRRGDVAQGLRRPHAPRTAHPVDPEVELVAILDAETQVRDMAVGELAAGDQVLIGGELHAIGAVLAPGVVELEGAGVVRLTRSHVLAVPAMAVTVPEPPAEPVEPADPETPAPPRVAPEIPSGDGEREQEQETLQVSQTAAETDTPGEAEPVTEAVFDERLHPRDREGRFHFDPRAFEYRSEDTSRNLGVQLRQRLSALPDTKGLTLLGGVRVFAGRSGHTGTGGKSRPRTYRVHGPGGHQDVNGPNLAADAALHASAASDSPDSLGGARRFGDYRQALLTDAQHQAIGDVPLTGWDRQERPVIGSGSNRRVVKPDGGTERFVGGTQDLSPVRKLPKGG